MRKIFAILFLVGFGQILFAQNELERQRIASMYNQEELKKLTELFRKQELEDKKKAYEMAKKKGWKIFITSKDGSISELQKVDAFGNPIYYTTGNVNAAISTRANRLWTGGTLGLNLNGQGMIIGEWDGGPVRNTHQEFGTRVTHKDGVNFTTPDGNNNHATHVAGTLIASGVDANAKGMAYQAELWGNEWNNDETEMTSQASQGLILSNHSYGYNSSFLSQYQFGFYDATSRDWDIIANNAPYYLIVKAAGNDRGSGYNTGAPFNTSGYNLITGSACSKNVLVVAAVNDVLSYTGPSSVTMSSFSSWGPTDDGRIKPDISGNGVNVYSTSSSSNTAYTTMSGTSMASPNVTGTLALIQQHYKNLNSGQFMRSATLRGLVIHTADEAGSNPGPDYAFGWGLLNAEKAVNVITNRGTTTIIDERVLNNGATYTLNVQATTSPLEVTICWNDPAGTPLGGTPLNNTTPMLVNDLDLRVSDGTTTFFPWRLDPSNPSAAATQGDNVRDNVEKVYIASPTPGATYTITVSHKGTLSSPQQYSLIVSTIANSGPPIVEFVGVSTNLTENSSSGNIDCRGYQDINIPLKISKVPSSAHNVSFSLSGTATNIADFELLTPTVTFNAGSMANQNLVVRVYNDQAIEGLENAVITISSVSGSAVIGATNVHTIAIADNDTQPLPPNAGGILFSDNFESGGTPGWTQYTSSGAVNIWRIGTQRVLNGNQSAYVSQSTGSGNYGSTAGVALLQTPVINASTYPANALQVTFKFQCNGESGYDFGSLFYALASSPTTWVLIEGTPTNPYVGVTSTTTRTVNLPAILNGQQFHLAWRWDNNASVQNQPAFVIDDIVVTALPYAGTTIETATFSAPTTPNQVYLGPNSTVYAYNPSNGKLIAKIENPTNHNYGCTQIYVDRAGLGALQFTTTPIAEYLASKTIRVIPSNNNPAGNYNIRIYYTEAEIAGWESVTSQNRNLAVISKTVGPISAATLGSPSWQSSATTRGTFGTDFWIEGGFSNGFSGFGVGLPPSSPLPLQLLSFKAMPQNDIIKLAWRTSQEFDVVKFIIEKSYNGREFFKIGEVLPERDIYEFFDEKPAYGDNYYRLKIEHGAQYYSFSNIEVVNWGRGVYCSVYPIPTIKDELIIEVKSFESTTLTYRLVNQLGLEILKGNFEILAHELTKKKLYLNGLSKGIYLLEIIYGGEKRTHKIVIN
ncbi:S8 family serine peptidase [Raineya sp.]|jgi:hypothetical protein